MKIFKKLIYLFKLLDHYFNPEKGPSGPIELVHWRVPNLPLYCCLLIVN